MPKTKSAPVVVPTKLAPGVPDPANYKVEIWPIGRVLPFQNNPKVHTPKAVAKLARVIEGIGVLVPVVVDKQGVIAKGHRTRLACLQLGLPKVPVHVARDATPAQLRQWRIDDNRLSEDSPWEETALKLELTELRAEGLDLTLTAFELPQLTKMFPEMAVERAGSSTSPGAGEDQFLCVVTCKSESELQALYEELDGRGFACKLMT